MSDRTEKMRAGIALLEMAAKMAEQAGVEFGGTGSDIIRASMRSAISDLHVASMNAVKIYDRERAKEKS